MEMQYRRLGRSGLKVSALSYGAWVTFAQQMGEDKAEACMRIAYEHGVNFFDNAEAYAAGEAEVLMGTILKKTGWRRDSYIISSKAHFGARQDWPTQIGTSRKHLVEACDQALQRLQLDYLDLYFCHRHDADTPVEEVVWTMNDLIVRGKILYWGTSQWPAERLIEAYEVARKLGLRGPTMEQPRYNMLDRDRVEAELVPLFEQQGLGTTIFSPLDSGLLTGKYQDGLPDDSRLALPDYQWLKKMMEENPHWESNLAKIKPLAELAAELETNLPRLALAWCLLNPHVSTVITGASKPEQVEDNMKAIEVLPRLTPEVVQRIETILDNRPEAKAAGVGFSAKA